MDQEEKYKRLIKSIKGLEKAAIAFSGGVDSALLAYAAKEALGENAVAFTVWSPLLPAEEKKEVVSFAERFGIKLFKIDHNDLECADFCENSLERCYVCKSKRLKVMISLATGLGIHWLLDGSNTNDLNDNRPGMRALKESVGTLSPLLQCGLSKKEIRELSSHLGLPTADKPAAACLASRIATGTAISEEIILKIDRGESIIRKYLPPKAQLRIRYNGITARIETDRENIPGLHENFSIIVKELTVEGLYNVVIEKDGYIMGGPTSRPI